MSDGYPDFSYARWDATHEDQSSSWHFRSSSIEEANGFPMSTTYSSSSSDSSAMHSTYDQAHGYTSAGNYDALAYQPYVQSQQLAQLGYPAQGQYGGQHVQQQHQQQPMFSAHQTNSRYGTAQHQPQQPDPSVLGSTSTPPRQSLHTQSHFLDEVLTAGGYDLTAFSPSPLSEDMDIQLSSSPSSSSANSSNRKPKANYPCLVPSCPSKSPCFARVADLERHLACVHNKATVATFDCHMNRCQRTAANGRAFTRKDHLTEHLRNYHHEEIPKKRRMRGVGFLSD
ncbi:hypothetical protein B0A49_01339 [Cryomyces minteri]|uniref:C2H2-type domain-containing protein n=1 Tax=Cryomyces minteri TaxID=331657 RepID=A0A4U0XZR0_9PEZI|nr:hypothetical protein B0A49_03467 [Cryomyces minteri]TKA81203.1 hypothetical protein B0A49_01339 [Cryomyces minteri]